MTAKSELTEKAPHRHQDARKQDDQLASKPYSLMLTNQIRYFAYRAHYQLDVLKLIPRSPHRTNREDSSAEQEEPPHQRPIQRAPLKGSQRRKRDESTTNQQDKGGTPIWKAQGKQNQKPFRKRVKAEARKIPLKRQRHLLEHLFGQNLDFQENFEEYFEILKGVERDAIIQANEEHKLRGTNHKKIEDPERRPELN